jgi:hypothetical protein
VRRTVRVPGQFELRAEARRDYQVVLPGRVRLLVGQFERVRQGQLLATVESPQWRQMQHEAVEARGEIKIAQAALKVAESSRQEAVEAIAFLRDRLATLSQLEVKKVDLEADLSKLHNTLPRLDAEVRARQVGLEEAQEHYDSRLTVLASIVGVPVERMREPAATTAGSASDAPNTPDGQAHGPTPYWQTIDVLELRARDDGIVDTVAVSDGGWLETGALALTTVNDRLLRFHAHAPQSDIGRFASGQRAQVVPPEGGAVPIEAAIPGDLVVGFAGHPNERTIPLLLTPGDPPAWAKPGVSAYLEVFIEGDEPPQLAIPLAAVVRDDLEFVFFRRNPRDENEATRTEADLGVNDGRWVVVKSGVAEGDEIVVEGAYALKLATSSRPSAPEGYHYHADGSLHKDH